MCGLRCSRKTILFIIVYVVEKEKVTGVFLATRLGGEKAPKIWHIFPLSLKTLKMHAIKML